MDNSKEKTFKLLENVIFLKKTALFSSMETGDLRAIAAIAEETAFKAEDEIVKEDDVGDSMYIIKDGIVIIEKAISEKEKVVLDESAKGDCFGEMALFDAELRSASVRAKEDCVLLCIKSDDLNDLLLSYPTIAIEFLKTFVVRLRKANETIEKLSAEKRNNPLL